jgi:Sigma-70, region 4
MNAARHGGASDGPYGILRAGWIHLRRSRLTLERELCDLLGTGRNARIAARYYGFDGRGGGTLQTVGNEVGLTRERVRQIVTAASERLSTGRPVSPTLDRAIALVADRMPAAAREVEAELQFQRLTSGLFRLEGIIQAAELLGRRLPFSITEVKGERLVHARDIPSVDTLVRIARRLISLWGMATISNVVADVRKVEPACDRNLVVSALACLGGFHWLEQSADWFWLSDIPNNRVLNRMRKILSVANPINISELWAGIGRDYRMKGFLPPKGVLLEFCRQVSGLRVNDETVTAEPAVSSDDVLSQVERDVVHILSEHGGTMATSEFKSACLGMGVIRTTFYHCMEYSPIISKYANGLYGLIGSGEGFGRGARLSFPEHRQGEHS